ncbi:MAG: sulfate/molybdate ABC transporter ATP-binding protein [Candidatus Acidiferrales bacterium]
MALEVQIEKRLASYTLNVAFTTGTLPLAILGPSGAGKTMTLRCIAGLERPDRGRIVLNGRVLFDSANDVDVPSRDRRIGMLFQNYALFPHMSVAQNIVFGLDSLSREERAACVKQQLASLELDGLENRLPRELSGGEQQRVALARALAVKPDALLLDEPLSALDTHLRSQVERQLLEALERFRGATLFVTHNIEEAYRVGSDMLVLSKGQTAAYGAKDDIFRHPPSLVVARLTGCKNISRAWPVSGGTIEAADWGCQLRVSQRIPQALMHAGIRAHHIAFLESGDDAAAAENVFPCWLVRASETPFRITLYLKLHSAPQPGDEPHLQAEIFKEKWVRFKDKPFPWHVRLEPDSLFVLPD